MRLHRFHGGLKLPRHKAESTASAIRPGPLPARLVVPLLQHAGSAARPCVEPGQQVLRGDRIGVAGGERGADVHASSSGRVHAVLAADRKGAGEAAVDGSASDGSDAAVVIECDGRDEWRRLPALEQPLQQPPATLLARIREAGVVGLGGAAFPTADKLAIARDLLVLNGAECEPYIACDDRLLRERAEDVVQGGLLLARITGAARTVLAIEDAMPEALAAARAAVAASAAAIEVVAVPTVFPEGGERQLIRVLTGREVPADGLPRDIGVLVQNVGTAAAAWRAAALGEALTSRIVTVTGVGVRDPGNFEVRFGTSVADLVAAAGGYTEAAARLVIGGPMMGQALAHDGHAIGKASNCVLVLGAEDVRDPAPMLPCIRCSACARVCPAQLLPQQLYAFIGAGQWARTADHGLDACIECGCCDLVCPSHLPLVEWFRFGKSELHARAAESALAAGARERFEARQRRTAREDEERAARRARAAAPDAVRATLARLAVPAPPPQADDTPPDDPQAPPR